MGGWFNDKRCKSNLDSYKHKLKECSVVQKGLADNLDGYKEELQSRAWNLKLAATFLDYARDFSLEGLEREYFDTSLYHRETKLRLEIVSL